jgi:hypothetical protein
MISRKHKRKQLLPFTREQARHKLTFDKKAFRKAYLSKSTLGLALQRYERVLAVQAILRGTSYEGSVPDRD